MLIFALPTYAQTIDNPDLWGDVEPTAVPNPATIAVTGWSYAAGGQPADVASPYAPIDCANLLLPSANGGHFAHALGLDPVASYRNEAISTTVTGLVPDRGYRVRFEAAIVRHYGQSTGRWMVTLGAESKTAPVLALPGNPAQQAWVSQSVDFTAAAAIAALRFEALSDNNGVTVSPELDGSGACAYASVPSVAGLLVDGIEIIPDTDGDGFFDDEDPCPDQPGPDTDADGIGDRIEFESGTDACNADTDGDGLDDGDELERGTDPLTDDTDRDGLSDGPEVDSGCDPLVADTDGDGLSDADELALGRSCVDPYDDVLTGTTIADTAVETGDTGAKYSIRWSGGCAQTPSGLGAVGVLAWLAVARRSRRR